MLETPTSGEVIVDGQVINDGKCDLNEVRKKMGMVFQSFNLFGHLTVIENIMNPQITLLGRSRQEAYDKAMDHAAIEVYPVRTLTIAPEVEQFVVRGSMEHVA
jgi:ABC-type polar amino acid transport system ATPase subunit